VDDVPNIGHPYLLGLQEVRVSKKCLLFRWKDVGFVVSGGHLHRIIVLIEKELSYRFKVDKKKYSAVIVWANKNTRRWKLWWNMDVGFHVGHTTEIWVVPWEEKVNTGK